MGVIRLGCSGWDYRDWAGVFYKDKEESKLRAYSRIFNTAEINSTFYSYPQPGIVFGWAKYTPQDFKFAVKLNRLITHEKMLGISKGVEDGLKRFCELMKPLQESGKLACILIQLPPGMKFRKDRIEEFLKILPCDTRFALEYRNEAWLTEQAHDLLRDYNVAAVAVDEPLLPPDIRLTSDIAYVRWHGRGEKMWYNYLDAFLCAIQAGWAYENRKRGYGIPDGFELEGWIVDPELNIISAHVNENVAI
ncbi:MAG: DUF72 domain-containing protein [Candidatus Methanoperedens sp.]